MNLVLVQILCFLFLNFGVHCSLAVTCHPNESSALLQFKDTLTNHTNWWAYCGDKLPAIDTWVKGTDCCSWDGITCDGSTGDVIGLDLSFRPLSGSITSNTTLLLLPHLQWLNLAFTYFDSSIIPSWFGLFTNSTYLNLSTSGFSGIIPFDLCHLSRLVSLDLSKNDLAFDDSVNGFEQFSVNLTKLIELDLSKVNMLLSSPKSLLNLSSSMKSLRLSRCSLQGNFPGDFSWFPSFELLDLSYNDGFVLNTLQKTGDLATDFSVAKLEFSVAKWFSDGLTTENFPSLFCLSLNFSDRKTVSVANFNDGK